MNIFFLDISNQCLVLAEKCVQRIQPDVHTIYRWAVVGLLGDEIGRLVGQHIPGPQVNRPRGRIEQIRVCVQVIYRYQQHRAQLPQGPGDTAGAAAS